MAFLLPELLVALNRLGLQVVDANGNALRQQGSFTYVNGSTGQMTDVWFTEDTAHSLPTELVEVPEEIAALPDVVAFGNVYDSLILRHLKFAIPET